MASSTFQIFFPANSDYNESSCAIKSVGFAHESHFQPGAWLEGISLVWLGGRQLSPGLNILFLIFPLNIDNMKHINTV